MPYQPSDFTFKIYDWNKLLKNKKLGEAVLSFKAITAAGSYHKLNLGAGNGTLLVFAKLYTSRLLYGGFPRLEPPTRILFDSSMGIVARPDEVMRIGYFMRVIKPVKLTGIVFEITQQYYGYKYVLIGASSSNVTLKSWSIYLAASDAQQYATKADPHAALPINAKHKPYGVSDNCLPKSLCPGIHYFHIEFTCPSRDTCGRFIGSGCGEDVATFIQCGVDLHDASDETLGRLGGSYRRDRTHIFLKSDFPFHLKPSLPPIYDPAVLDEASLWLEKVKVVWATPDEGRNRTSPLPPHLYNPEVISDEDRQRWYLPNDDILDAHGQERIYANLIWSLGNPFAARKQVPHYVILANFTIDDTLDPSIADKPFKIEFGVRLICDRFTVSSADKTQSVRNTFIYTLKPTNKNVGHHKREYEIVSQINAPAYLIYTLPVEVHGHLQTSYVYVEVIATNSSKPEEFWVLQRRPFFVESTPNSGAHSSKPIEPTPENGSFKVGYTRYEFLDRPLDVVGDFGESLETFGPDRLV